MGKQSRLAHLGEVGAEKIENLGAFSFFSFVIVLEFH